MKRRILTLALTVALLLSMLVVPTSASALSKTKVKILRVTVDEARLREGPSSQYAKIISLNKGSKVFYLKKMKDSFAYICTEDGVKGYMYRGFLEDYGVVYAYQVYRSKQNGVNVYKKASTNSDRVARLSKNQHVVVYQVSAKWAYVRTLGGKGGYVQKSALTKAK